MNSPVTGKPMRLVKEPSTKLSFQNEEFEITYHYYRCDDTGEQYTTEELDKINITQVHNLQTNRLFDDKHYLPGHTTGAGTGGV